MQKIKTIKFHLVFIDRVGIVFDITKILTETNLNIVSMEIDHYKKKTDDELLTNIYIELQKTERSNGKFSEKLLQSIKGCIKLEKIEELPREKRSNRFKALFDNVSDGIISFDEKGRISTINRVAEQILSLNAEKIKGHNFCEINGMGAVEDCFSNKIPINKWETIITINGRVEFFASAKPFLDKDDGVSGAVLIMKNHKEVKEIIDAASRPSQTTFDDFIGKTSVIKQLKSFGKKIARTDSIVSLYGESGTGKELFARAIHFESGRKGPFVPVNCAAMPEPLLESELFGYSKGAFTGARKNGKPGLFEVAENGTMFLDEIGDMPPGPQAKILRVLQEGRIRRIGGSKEIPVNCRIITATNKNLFEMVEKKKFRGDLYYRINVFPIHIPPLKERLDDIPEIIKLFLYKLNKRLEIKEQIISDKAIQKLYKHSWPGNVRELKNVIERAAILNESDLISEKAIFFSNSFSNINRYYSEEGNKEFFINGDTTLKILTNNFEKNIIQKELKSKESIRKIASKLGLSHTGLIKKIKRFNL